MLPPIFNIWLPLMVRGVPGSWAPVAGAGRLESHLGEVTRGSEAGRPKS